MELFFLNSLLMLLVGGVVAYLLEPRYSRGAGLLGLLCLLGAVVWSMPTLFVEHAEFSLGLFKLVKGLSIDFAFRVSPLTSMLNFFVLLFGLCVLCYTLGYYRPGEGGGKFYACSLWAVAGASAALMTSNLLVFILAWEFVTVMLYLLMGLGGSAARKGAFKTFAMLGFSDVVLLLGIACLFMRHGASAADMTYLESAGRIYVSEWADIGIYLLLLVGALTKAAAFPLHTWLPTAAEESPVPTLALLPASLDKLLGIVLLLRISIGFFVLSTGLKVALMCIGGVTIIAGVMMALIQHRLQKLLAFHAISQVGYMVMGIGTGVPVGVVGGVFHMLNNAIYKNLLFLGGGAVRKRVGHVDLDYLGGLSRAMPFTFAGFLVGALAISGVPPLNGFVSKWLIYQGVIEGGGSLMPWLLAAAVLGSALTLASFIKAIHSIFLGQPSDYLEGGDVPEASAEMLFPIGVLAGLCVVLGLGAGVVVSVFLAPSIGQMGLVGASDMGEVLDMSYRTGLWGPLPAMVLIGVGLAAGLLFYGVGRVFRVRRVRSFMGGEVSPTASTRYSGTQFYKTIRDLPVIRALYSDAEEETWDIYRMVGLHGQSLTGWISGLHTGLLETYATWCVLGVGAVVAVLFLLM